MYSKKMMGNDYHGYLLSKTKDGFFDVDVFTRDDSGNINYELLHFNSVGLLDNRLDEDVIETPTLGFMNSDGLLDSVISPWKFDKMASFLEFKRCCYILTAFANTYNKM